ncbi:MAG: thiazole biosynthesis adenylyltransferase ThiF [Actinobacteria bacterium]|nr:thiazole biosynthesis adenylyltransferase ThiF [Actinomycetota bacterium]
MGSDGGFERYSRQMLLPQIGRTGQQKLAAARIGVIGCGALGSVIASHLVRAGVGLLRIVDKDYLEMHNLQRQIVFTEEDVARGLHKAEAAAAYLRKVNSRVMVESVVAAVDVGNLPVLADDLDLLVDGTDNFPTRFSINDYAVARGMPWVYGGVITTAGMSMTIVPGEGPCLRCLVPELPPREQSLTTDVVGVLNTVAAVIGSVEATEAIKLVVDPAARSRALLVVDLWGPTCERLDVPQDPDCACCGSRRTVAAP